MAEPSTAAVTPNSLAPSSSPLLAPSPVGPLVHPKQEPGAWNDLVSSYGAAMLPTVMYPTMNIKCSPDSPPPPSLSLHHQHDDHHSDVDEELSMIAAKHHQAVNNNSLSLESGTGPKVAVAPIWNPGNISPVASLPLPPPTSVHPSYHPMLMMKMMMMNMEHKASLAAAGLNPMSAGAHHLFARLNEFNQMAAAAAAAAASSSMPSQANFEHPSESQSTLAQVGLQQANLQLQASTGDGNSVSKPKRVRNRKSAVNGGSPRSRSTKAVSANRRLVPSTLLSQSDPTAPPKLGNPIYRCHLCPYTGNSKLHFNAHMNTHFDHRCPHCDYTSRTEGRLKRHIRDFHSETPPETWSGNRAKDSDNDNPGLGPDGEVLSGDDSNAGSGMCAGGNGPNPARNRKYRCKQCNYVAIQKHDYWEHTKQHIKTDKMLNCPKCNFVTEFKHHLVYHLRNHFGSKPFKCAKCNYSCVNKSMLNSHMKSHSNIYQYRCEDCTYATKYCHSLKLHLRKYAHRPATVLNLDGTPNPYPVIDVYGTRRGPRPKKGSAAAATFGSDGDGDEEMMDEEIERTVAQNLSMDLSSSASSSTSEPNHPSTPPPAPQAPVMGQVAVVVPQPKLSSDSTMVASHRQNGGSSSNAAGANYLKCDYCPFQTESKQEFSNHLLNHVMNEKQSLVNSRKNASSRVKSSTTQQSNHQQVSNKEQQHSSLPVVGSQSTTPPLTPGSGALSASPFELPLALESPIQNQAYPPFLTPFHHHSQQHHQPADFMTFGSHHHPRTLPTSTPPTFPHQFTCGELTPPTPTDETEAAAAKQAETPFKPLDLSGKVHHNHNQVQVASPERSKEQADGFVGCGGDLNESPSVGTNPTMALILMNSLLLNAQRNLKDALENASEASSSPEPSVASGGASRPESVNSMAVPSPAVEDELKHRARSLKRKGRANRLDLSKLANSDEEEEEDEEEMEAEEENELENGFVEQENSLNYFEMLKNVPLTNESYDESPNEDNSSERDEPERYHQLPPTPTKSPKQLLQQQQQSSRQSTNIFDFTDESQSNQMMADQNGGVGSMMVTSPQQIQQQHPSAGLSPAIVQLLAQMLQTNPSLNPALVVQQLLPQLLLEGNCNLDSITALLTKVYSATSLMQDILLEMCAAKK